MSCNSFNVTYVLICLGCLEECNEKPGLGKARLRDRVRVYRQHIKQLEYQKLKVEEHIRICRKDSFRLIPFLQMLSNDTNLRRAYETKSQREYKTKLGQLWQVKSMTQRMNVFTIVFKNLSIRDHHFFVRFNIVTCRECLCLTP